MSFILDTIVNRVRANWGWISWVKKLPDSDRLVMVITQISFILWREAAKHKYCEIEIVTNKFECILG